MKILGLDACVQSCSLDNANPTGAVFGNFGPQTVHVKGTISDVNKNQRNIEITHHFTTSMADELPSIEFTIKPFYWQTLWFKMLVVMVVFSVFYSLYRLKISRIRREENLKSEFRKKIAEVEMQA